MPSLERLHQHFKDKPFRIIAIDVGEEKEIVQSFVNSRDISYENLLDKDGKISRNYGVRSHPMKFLINSEGGLAGIAGGYREWDSDEMKALIEILVNNSKTRPDMTGQELNINLKKQE